MPVEDALGEELGELRVEDRLAGVKVEILSPLGGCEAGSAHADGNVANEPAAGGADGRVADGRITGGCNSHDRYREDK